MILNEGVLVKIRGDNRDLLQSFKGGKFAAGAFATAVAGSFAAVTAASVRMSAQLDRDLRLIQTLGGEAADSSGRLREEIKQLGVEFGRDFRQLARANYQAVSSGFSDIAESMKVTRAATKLAITGNGDLAQSTTVVAGALNAFGKSSDDAEETAAQLFAIIRDGVFDVQQLTQFLSDLPATAAASGLKLREIGAALATMTANNVPANRAVDQLRSLLIKLEQEGITGTLLQRIEQLRGRSLPELVELLGEQQAALAANTLARSFATLSENTEKAKSVTADFAEAVDVMNSGPAAEYDKTMRSIADHMDDLGTVVLRVALPALQSFNEVLDSIDPTNFERVLRSLGAATGVGTFAQLLGIAGGGGARPNILPAPPGQPAPQGGGSGAGGGANTNAVPVVGDNLPQGILDMETTAFGRRGRIPRADRGNERFPSPSEVRRTIAGDLGPPPEFEGLSGDLDDMGQSAAIASQMTGILASSVGGLLVSAFGQAESAAGRFAMGLLAQFAQLGAQIGVSALIPGEQFLGFASGGFTGGRAGQPRGIVHGNEYVFNDKAVSAIGLGRLERMHAAANAGSTANTVNVTVNAGSGDAASIANVTADTIGQKLRELQTTNRGSLYTAAPQKYRR